MITHEKSQYCEDVISPKIDSNMLFSIRLRVLKCRGSISFNSITLGILGLQLTF